MDFEKTSISTKIEKHLLDNLKTDKEKESLNNVIIGKALLKSDAITLLRSLLQAMTFLENLGNEEFSDN